MSHLVLSRLTLVSVLTAVAGLGCSLSDSNKNPKARYALALNRASRALQDAGSPLRPYSPDYELEQFSRQKRDGNWEELYDFVKVSPGIGPERFVIAYDYETRSSAIRTDLRSRQDLDRLPPATTQVVPVSSMNR